MDNPFKETETDGEKDREQGDRKSLSHPTPCADPKDEIETVAACQAVMETSDKSEEKEESEKGSESGSCEEKPLASDGSQPKRLILFDLASIHKRLEACKKQHVFSNWTYTECFGQNKNEVLFPKGFGFYLRGKNNFPLKEEFVTKVQRLIMNIQSMEIQDGLYYFLEDYMMQDFLLENLDTDRKELLEYLKAWFQRGGIRALIKHKKPCVEQAVDVEVDLQHVCVTTLHTMERLAALRKQLMMVAKIRKEQHHLDSADIEVQMEEAMKAELKAAKSQPIEELQKLLHNIKGHHNKEIVTRIENKLEDISVLLSLRVAELARLREIDKKKQDEKANLKETISGLKEYNNGLAKKILEAKEEKKTQVTREAAAKRGDLNKRGSSIHSLREKPRFRENFGCQVGPSCLNGLPGSTSMSSFAFEDSTPKAKPKKKPKGQRKIMPGKTASDSIQKHLQKIQSEPAHATLRRGKSKTASKNKTEAVLHKGKKHGVKDGTPSSTKIVEAQAPPRGEELLTMEEETRLRVEQTQQLAESFHGLSTLAKPSDIGLSEAKSSPQMGYKSISSEKKTETERKESILGKGSPGDSLAEAALRDDLKRLKLLVTLHIKNLLAHAQPLLTRLLALRKNARTEIKRVKSREQTMCRIEKMIGEFLKTIPAQKGSLPDVTKTTTDDITVSNRVPEPHRCPLCMCKETVAEEVNMRKLKSSALQQRTQEAFKDYTDIVNKMAVSYDYANATLTEGLMTIQHVLSQLVWGELGTSDYNELDEDFDSEMEENMFVAQKLPESLSELIKHAIFVTNTVCLLSKNIATIVINAKHRMTDVQQQNEQLRVLETKISFARASMNETVIHLTRFRAGEDMLKNGVIFGSAKCQCCKCYNSFLTDGTRICAAEDPVRFSKMSLLKSMALLEQGLGAVFRPSENSQIALGTTPRLIENIHVAQRKLLDALFLMTPEEIQSLEDERSEWKLPYLM